MIKMDSPKRFIVLWNTPCPYKDICRHGKTCRLRGIEVVQCNEFNKIHEEELEKTKQLIRKYVRKKQVN